MQLPLVLWSIITVAAILISLTQAGAYHRSEYSWRPSRRYRHWSGSYRYQPIEDTNDDDQQTLAVRVEDSRGNTRFLEPINNKVSRSIHSGFAKKNDKDELESTHDRRRDRYNKYSRFHASSSKYDRTDRGESRYDETASAYTPESSTTSRPWRRLRPPHISKRKTTALPSIDRGYLPPVNNFRAPVNRPVKNLSPPQLGLPTRQFGSPDSGTDDDSVGYQQDAGYDVEIPEADEAAYEDEAVRGTSAETLDDDGDDSSQEVNPPGGADLRRNLSDRVDGSVFFGILPVPEGVAPPGDGQPTTSGKSLLSNKPGECPFIDMTMCPLTPNRKDFPPTCSNDQHCAWEERCCYNPCLVQNECVQPTNA